MNPILLSPSVCKDKDIIEKINKLRKEVYPSAIIQDHKSLENIWLICIKDKNKNLFVGYVEIEIQNAHFDNSKEIAAFIHNFHICKNWQKKGIGKVILKAIIDKNICVQLIVSKDNISALKLVRKMGFKEMYNNQGTIQMEYQK